jgi:hypothetical protein
LNCTDATGNLDLFFTNGAKMKAQDESKIRRQLQVVEQWRASGQSKKEWSAAHGMQAKQLMGWITYERRWRARLSGEPVMPRKGQCASAPAASHSAQFARLRLASDASRSNDQTPQPSIRIECPQAGLILHWPLEHSTKLAGLLQALRTADQRPQPPQRP